MKRIILYTLIIIALIVPQNLYPQMFSGTVDYSLFYDDNPLRQNDGSEEFINSAQTRLDFKPFNREFYIFYSGGYDAFKNLDSRNYQNHYLGLNYAFSTSDSSDENIFTGFNYSIKRGTSDYAVYDFNQLSAFINGTFYLKEDLIFQSAYRISYKNFPDLSNLTYTENLGSIGLSKFLPTKTGLFFQSSIGNKNYSTAELLQTTFTPGMHQGMGRRGNQEYINSFSITQLRTSFKISQSVFENTGISAFYINRTNLTGTQQNFQSTELIYSDDSDLWDDPYGFESNEYGLELTQILAFNVNAKLSFEYANRHYLNNAADSLNQSGRVDNKTELWVGVSKVFNSFLFMESFEAGIEYMYILNQSNSSLFDYRNNLIQVALQFSF